MKRVNLIPHDVLIAGFLGRQGFIKLVLFFFLFLCFITVGNEGMVFFYKFHITKKKEQIEGLKKLTSRISDEYDQVRSDRKRINLQRQKVAQKLALLQESDKIRTDWLKVLVKMSSLVPEDTRLTKILLEDEKVTLQGKSDFHASVGEFMARLDESQFFQETGFNYIQKAQDKDSSYVEFEVFTYLLSQQFKTR